MKVIDRFRKIFSQRLPLKMMSFSGGWDNLLAVIPGGSSTPLIPKQYANILIFFSISICQTKREIFPTRS